MSKIRPNTRAVILKALLGGVVPRDNIQYIQVGRKQETEAILRDLDQVENGSGAIHIISANFGSGKTFILSLANTLALKKNFCTMSSDLSPDRRLYSTSGAALNLYRSLIRSLATPIHPIGALPNILDNLVQKLQSLSQSDKDIFQTSIRKKPFGFDCLTVLNMWAHARNDQDSFLEDAVLRWFSGEATNEHKRLLTVKSNIDDDSLFDMLQLLAWMVKQAGFAGLYVEFDELINLYNIVNKTSRERNYEQILKMINDSLQGESEYLGYLLAGTPEAIMDPMRGLFSYEALYSRLVSHVDDNSEGILMNLSPLTQEDLLVLLKNIANVEAMGEEPLVNQDNIEAFMKAHFDVLGAEYYKTPRELIRSFTEIMLFLRKNPDISFTECLKRLTIIGDTERTGMSDLAGVMDNNSSTLNIDGAEPIEFDW